MNTDTLDDRMMICSNGPPVSPQNKQTIGVIVDLAFKRLSMKFEGRWSTARYKRVCNRCEAPEGYLLFRYKDKGTKCIAHMLDLQEYGVTKEW
jgi:hypothetical protein